MDSKIPQTDATHRVRSYLNSQGEKYTFTELWVRLIKARVEILNAVEKVSQAQADFRPEADEWTISEVIHHLITSSGRVRKIVESLSGGESPFPGRVDPPREETFFSIEELRSQLRSDSIVWSALTERLPHSPPTKPTALHTVFGELHARAWYLFQRVHDLDHSGQIVKNKHTTGYPED